MSGRIHGWMRAGIMSLTMLVASSATADTSRADKLFQEGRTAAVAADYATARAKFIESHRLDPAVGTLLNIADCDEHLAHPAAALAAFRMALPQLEPTDVRHAITKERIAALEKRVPRLTVSLAPGAPTTVRVLRDGIPLAPRDHGVPAFVEPGLHLVTMETNDGQSHTTNVTLIEGQSESLVLDPRPFASPEKPAEPKRPGASTEARSSTQLHLGLVALGVGTAGVAVAAISWANMIAKSDTIDRACDSSTKLCSGSEVQAALEAQDSGRTWSIVNYAAWGVGAAGLATGAVLLLTRNSERTSRVSVVAAPLPGGGNIGASASF